MLKHHFSLIFSIAVDQEALVASYLDIGSVMVWDIRLRRQVQEGLGGHSPGRVMELLVCFGGG